MITPIPSQHISEIQRAGIHNPHVLCAAVCLIGLFHMTNLKEELVEPEDGNILTECMLLSLRNMPSQTILRIELFVR